MATTTLPPARSAAGRLTASFQAAQARRAAAIAALVVAYYRTRVKAEDPASVDKWLEIMVPRILREHDQSMTQAALFGNALRTLEVPAAPSFRFEPLPGATAEQIRRSLLVVGPEPYARKATEIRALPNREGQTGYAPRDKVAMIRDLDKATEVKIAGAAVRHSQAGARETIVRGTGQDKTALGFVRVTRDRPCYFCALLASRGLQRGYAYTEDSFDVSDSLFANGKVPGTAKVHDHCQCQLKPVYSKTDDYLDRSQFFMDIYQQSPDTSINSFRKVYNDFLAGITTTGA